MSGKFITLEGIDGAGKSTHALWVAHCVRRRGHAVKLTREPGGTDIGEKLRELLLSRNMHVETETLLMFAARREHLQEVIRPALNADTWVISDRFSDASYAYQGGGGGLAFVKIEALERWTHPDFQPDLTLFFDVPIEVARERLIQGRANDRFEGEASDYFRRVREVYRQRAARFPERIRVVDSAKPLSIVQKQLEEILAKFE